jgi:hypothetical protein
METARLGRTDIELTRIGLGCGSFGGVGSDPATWGQGESEEEAFELLDAAVAAGIGFLDTAASYGGGRSEAYIGHWREERGSPVLLSSKVFSSVTGDPDDFGLAGERILREIGGTRERLRTERSTCTSPTRRIRRRRSRSALRARRARARREGAGDRRSNWRRRSSRRRWRRAGASASPATSGCRTSTACSSAAPRT